VRPPHKKKTQTKKKKKTTKPQTTHTQKKEGGGIPKVPLKNVNSIPARRKMEGGWRKRRRDGGRVGFPEGGGVGGPSKRFGVEEKNKSGGGPNAGDRKRRVN